LSEAIAPSLKQTAVSHIDHVNRSIQKRINSIARSIEFRFKSEIKNLREKICVMQKLLYEKDLIIEKERIRHQKTIQNDEIQRGTKPQQPDLLKDKFITEQDIRNDIRERLSRITELELKFREQMHREQFQINQREKLQSIPESAKSVEIIQTASPESAKSVKTLQTFPKSSKSVVKLQLIPEYAKSVELQTTSPESTKSVEKIQTIPEPAKSVELQTSAPGSAKSEKLKTIPETAPPEIAKSVEKLQTTPESAKSVKKLQTAIHKNVESIPKSASNPIEDTSIKIETTLPKQKIKFQPKRKGRNTKNSRKRQY